MPELWLEGEIAHLTTFVGQALRNEMGVTNPIFPRDLASTKPPERPCAGESAARKTTHANSPDRGVRCYVENPERIARERRSDGSDSSSPPVARVPTRRASTAARTHYIPIFCCTIWVRHSTTESFKVKRKAAIGARRPCAAPGCAGVSPRRRATTIADAVLAHDGEATSAVQNIARSTRPHNKRLSDCLQL